MWPALITGGLGLLGNIFSSNQSSQNAEMNVQAQQAMQGQAQAYNSVEAQRTRDFQAQQILDQRSYETNMSNSAYRRSYADMMAAGLNPMMMFNSGGPATTPSTGFASGATASTTAPNVATAYSARKSPLEGLGEVAGKAIDAAVSAKHIEKASEEIASLKVQQDLTRAQIKSEELKPEYITAQTGATKAGVGLTHQDIEKRVQDTKKTAEEVKQAEVDSEKARAYDEVLKTELGRKIIQGGILGKSASDMIQPLKDILEGITDTALRKRGLDLLKEKMLKGKSGREIISDPRRGNITRTWEEFPD